MSWHSCTCDIRSSPSLRFVAPIPHHQTFFMGRLSKQKPPKTFIWASLPACESQSSVRSCFFTLIRFDWCLVASLGKASNITFCTPQHPGDHYPANTGRTHLFGFSIKPIFLKWSLIDDELETAWCITAEAKSSTEDNPGQGEYWRKVL